MAVCDFSALTTAQLQTMRDNLIVAINNLITGEVQSSSAPDGGSWANYGLDKLTDLLSCVSGELAARDPSLIGETGGLIKVEFGEPT